MHRCNQACFAHEQRQGSGCLCDTNAGRIKLGLSPLTGDEPELDIPGWLKFLVVAGFSLSAAIACGYLDSLFPRL